MKKSKKKFDLVAVTMKPKSKQKVEELTHDSVNNSKQTEIRCSKRTRRQIKFGDGIRVVVEDRNVENSINNNAQLVVSVKSNEVDSSKLSNKKVMTKVPDMYDGVQISVNSDEEQDYEDVVEMGEDEDDGSIDLDVRNVLKATTLVQETTDSELQLGELSASLSDKQLIMNNPHLRKLFNKMLDERIHEAQ